MSPTQAAQQQRAMLIENAKRELRALTQQRNIAEQGIEALSAVAARLTTLNLDHCDERERAMSAAIMALCSIRLLELQTNCENSQERIPKLEAFLKQAESNIAVPSLMI